MSLIQNSRTDCQAKQKPKKDEVFRQTLQTPLSLGLGGDYRNIIDIEKRVEQAVLGRMIGTGGYCKGGEYMVCS